MNDELKKLYDVLSSKGYYTKSFDEFVVKYQEPEYRDKLFGVVTRDGLYTKSREEFDAKYSVQPLKKKEPSEVSSQEEQLASPMETPSLATLPGRDLTLPPSPSLALETRQAIEQAGGVLPEEQPIPVPYEARPTEVTTDDGITLDLETGGIEGESGVAPEAMEAMQERIATGAVAMPEAQPIPEGEVEKGATSEFLEPMEITFGEWIGDKWNGALEGIQNWIDNIRTENNLNGQVIAQFIEESKEKHPELYTMYLESIDKGSPKSVAANVAYMKYFVEVDKGIENEILPYIKAAGREEIVRKAGYSIDKQKEKVLQDRFFSGAVRGLMSSLPAMATSASTFGLSFMDMSYQAAEEQLSNELAANPELNMSETQRNAYLLAVSGIEGILEKVGLSNTLKGRPMLKRLLAGKVLTRIAGMGDDIGAEAFERVVRQEAKGLKGYAGKILKGGLSEFETGALQELSGSLINQFLVDSQGKAIFKPKTAKEIVMDVLYAGAQEAVGGGIIAGTIGAFSKPDGVSKDDFKKAKEFLQTIKISEVEKHLDRQVSSGKMERAEKQRILNNINEFKQALDKTPDDLSEESQAEMLKLISEKQSILSKVEGKDDAIKAVAKEKVAAIDEKIKNIYISEEDAVQKQTAGEVPVQPEATVGEEVAQGTTQTEPEVATQEGVEEEVALTEEEQQQLEALRGETLGKVPTEGATVEEVTSIFEKGRKLSDNLVVNEQGAQPLTKEQTRIEKLAVRGAKAIQKLLPDVKVVLHASADTYAQSAADTAEGRGTYDDSTKTIHINLATADASTVAHEVFHAIFLNKVKTDPKAQAVAKRMMESVRKTLPDNSALAVEIDKFAKDYDASFQNEERLAQLMGAMSREYVNATSTVKGQIVEFIKRLARAFNVLLPSEFGKTDQSVTAMLDVLSRKVAKGKEIVAADLVVLDRSAEPGSTVVSGTVAENISDKGAKPIDINAKRRQQLNRGGIDMAAIKRGSINDLSGANAFVFAADQATYGEIESPSGAKYNFKGGYLYPYGSGMAWAFTTEAAANKILKKAQQSDGVGLVMSQASDGITGSMSFYEYMLEEIKNAVANGAKESDIVAYVNEKLKVTEVQDALNKKGKPLQIKKLAELENLMPIEGQGKFSYEERSAFTKVFFSAKSYEQFGIPPLKPTAKMSTGVLDFVNDPSLEKAQYGDIISAIQFNKDSKIIDTRKEGMDVHPSYPFAIEGAPLMVFNNAVDVRKVYPDAKPKTGAQVELGKRAKPQAARSAMGAQYVAEVPSEIIEEPTVITLEADNAMRRQKGLITVTPSESLKYKRAGIEDKYQQQAVKMAAELISAATRYRDEGDGIGGTLYESRLSTRLSENKGTDVNSIVASINKSSPGLSPPEALDVFINRVNYSISNDLALDDRYLGASLNIVDGPAVTSAILFEASQAEEMGLSRAIVASLKEKAKEGSSERRQVIDEYQRTQHSTLDKWARYLRNDGPSSWALRPGLKLMLVDAVITHNYDAATGKYIKRTNKTLRNYTPYDEGTISRLFAEGNPASNALLKEYVELMASNATNVVKAFKLEDTAEGTWLKFPGGASVSGDNLNLNANALSQLVQDTPWCTKNSAVGQLSGGDFYVFVTEEKNGDPKPRVAIKTTNGRLDEARGILDGQQMEPRMRPVFEAFLQKDILTDGAKWLEGQRFNERVKGFREEILKRPLSFEDFTTMDELKQEAGRYSFMQYGQNGFLERLQEDLDIKIAQDDFVTELKGKVAAHSEDLKSTTEILIADFDGEAVFLNIMRDLALTMMKDGKTIQDIRHATLPVFDVASSVFGNPEVFPTSLMQGLVLVRGGRLYQVESVLASLIEAYGKQKATQLLSAAVLDKTKSLKKIGDVFDPLFLPIPQSLKVVGKSVIIRQGNNTGNIISANRLTIYNNTPDFEIGVVKVTHRVSIEEPIKSFGKLEEVGTINASHMGDGATSKALVT
jgi:hypothetical protein